MSRHRPPGGGRHDRLTVLVTVPLLTLTVLTAASPAQADVLPTVAEITDTTPGQRTVVLVTGDTVLIEDAQDGRRAVVVEPAPRPSGSVPEFEVVDDGDDVYVIPTDAAPFVPDRLDRELFNVAKLTDYGYDDGVPVIVTDAPAAAVASTPAGLTDSARLTSVDGYAAVVEPDGDWWADRLPVDAGIAAASDSGKVWLDEIVEVALDESVPMIGAPEAWADGFDGTGTTVAVLDTGVDAEHPDLVGQIVASKNFTSEPDVDDGHGHGTHVAGTIAGTGDGSDGAFTGVAPGADLVIGKICTSSGSCPNSGTIAAMEWAATRADVVNMSIGSSSGDDGTAPTALAVDRLTAEHDVLFVVAAGNNGAQGPGSVGAPGSADAALTVGAVDKDGNLARFSSRGPRTGDSAVKPDITAPGVGIVAPRASGTSMGTPVDDLYTSANGTSMATPHVTGSAAIALQASPDLTAAQLKADLVTTAAPHHDLSVYEQGGGLVAIPAAIAAPVVTTPAPLNLGFFAYPHDDVEPVETTVDYVNRSSDPVDLSLALDVTDGDGTAVPEAALSVEPSTVTIPVGGTATVTVTLDAAGLPVGTYGGGLVAAIADDTVRTPVGFDLEAEMYELTINAIARDGRPADKGSTIYVADSRDTAKLSESVPLRAGTASLRVPPGDYFVGGAVYTYDGTNVFTQSRTMVGSPTLTVDEDTSLSFDARDGEEITTETPEHPESSPFGNQARLALRFTAEHNGTWGVTYVGPWAPLFSIGSDPVEVGEFEFVSGPRMTAPHMALSMIEPVESDVFVNPLSGPPALDETMDLPLAYVGDGADDDYADLDVRRKAVLTSRTGPGLPEKEAIARAHGAKAVLVMNSADGRFSGSMGPDATLPGGAVSGEDGGALRDRLAEGPVTVRISGTADSPYMYDLVHPVADRIPHGGAYVDDVEDLAVVDNTFHGVPGHTMSEYRAMWRPGQVFGPTQYTPIPAATERVEYVSPGDSLYRQRISGAWVTTGGVQERDITYDVGDVVERPWFKSPMRSGLWDRYGSRNPGSPVTRTGDTIRFVVPEWFDNCVPGGYGAGDPTVDTMAFRAYRDGELFGTAPRPSVVATVGPEPAEYRFEVDVERNAAWWPTSTKVSTAWTFPSAHTEERVVLPLLQATYDAPVDVTNTMIAPSGDQGPATLGVHIAHQVDAAAPDVTGVRVWISYDDGETWRKRPVMDLGDGDFRAILDSPSADDTPSGFASLKVEAWDADGNRIQQRIDRAWRMQDR